MAGIAVNTIRMPTSRTRIDGQGIRNLDVSLYLAAPMAQAVGQVQIREGTVSEMFSKGADLMIDNWAESGRPHALTTFTPSIERYEEVERQGLLLILVATMDDDWVGYSVNMIFPHMHMRESLCCCNDAIYVKPKKRSSAIARMLLEATEKAATKRGAVRMLWGAPPGSALDVILPRRGYDVAQTTYTKDI